MIGKTHISAASYTMVTSLFCKNYFASGMRIAATIVSCATQKSTGICFNQTQKLPTGCFPLLYILNNNNIGNPLPTCYIFQASWYFHLIAYLPMFFFLACSPSLDPSVYFSLQVYFSPYIEYSEPEPNICYFILVTAIECAWSVALLAIKSAG